MHANFIFLIIAARYLQKQLKTKTDFPKWHKAFMIMIGASVVMIAINHNHPNFEPYALFISHVLFLVLAYLLLKQKEFVPVRSMIFAVIPFMLVNFIDDIIVQFSKPYYEVVEDYFDIGKLFAIVWFIAILIYNNKQKKALEKERLRNEEKDKELKIKENLRAQLEVEVEARTADLTLKKNELESIILELKSTQAQLIQSEKMASLGELTAGIAHEIQNPLNFVNNFSEVTNELIDEMNEELKKGDIEEAMAIATDIKQNMEKINHHGKRADAIVKGMLQHSRSSSDQKEPTDINKLADEYLRLAYHGLRAKDKSFNASMDTHFDQSIGLLNIVPQDMGRVILNLITNAFYAVNDKKKKLSKDNPEIKFEPTVSVISKIVGANVALIVKDNANGIPQQVIDKIFQPFFTTKPTGEGTGLGLSLAYDIVKSHGGVLSVTTKEGEGSEFTITLPKS